KLGCAKSVHRGEFHIPDHGQRLQSNADHSGARLFDGGYDRKPLPPQPRSTDLRRKRMRVISAAVAVFAISISANVSAAEITLIAPGGIRAAVEQMIPAFEKKTGNTVKATFGSGNGTKQRVVT